MPKRDGRVSKETLTAENTSSSQEENQQGKLRGTSGWEWAPLVVILCVSRACGVAPVRFERARRGCPCAPTASARLHLYGYILITLLHIGIIAGVIRDGMAHSHGVRLRTSWSSFTFYAELVIVMSITSIAAYGAPQRLRWTIVYLDVVDKIKSAIECPQKSKYATIYVTFIVFYMILIVAIYAADFYSFFSDSYYEGRDYYVMYYYICFYCELFITVILALEFMWLAVFVQSGLKSINKALEDLIYIIDLQRTSETLDLEVNKAHIPRCVEPVNSIVDTMSSELKTTSIIGESVRPLKFVPDNIRSLARSYGTICDVIAGINDNYGWLLILFITSFILHFITTPLFLITFWYNYKSRSVNLTVLFFHVFFYISNMFLVIEPGHMTEQQNEDIQVLTRRLLQRSSDQTLDELDILLKLITLNKVYYKPLQMCTLNRSLITVIVGAATTYLVIILQFQRVSEDDF